MEKVKLVQTIILMPYDPIFLNVKRAYVCLINPMIQSTINGHLIKACLSNKMTLLFLKTQVLSLHGGSKLFSAGSSLIHKGSSIPVRVFVHYY